MSWRCFTRAARVVVSHISQCINTLIFDVLSRDAHFTRAGDLAYQGRLLLLLAKICSGRAHDAIAKCQVLLPLASCIENIVSLSHPALLATGGGLLAALLLAAYVDFVVAVYLESESPLVISDIVRISEALGEVLRVHLVATAPDALSGKFSRSSHQAR